VICPSTVRDAWTSNSPGNGARPTGLLAAVYESLRPRWSSLTWLVQTFPKLASESAGTPSTPRRMSPPKTIRWPSMVATLLPPRRPIFSAGEFLATFLMRYPPAFDGRFKTSASAFDRVIGSNFKGAYFTIQKALPLLRQGSSVIINASVTARRGWPTTSTVSPCKAAVINLARILSSELVDRGIRVNTLSPGPTDTAMFGRFPGEEQGDAVKGLLRTNNPSKRLADPVEIAKLAVYLASDDSAYVVGADFLIDGGATAISAVGG
jgi:NAD(P)-dependent dehydrogenase (short-subunit alcohol dehydrogenase family)